MIWKEWIKEKGAENGAFKTSSISLISIKKNPDNHPDTLKNQLNALKSIGFKKIDCFYKLESSLFTVGKNKFILSFF